MNNKRFFGTLILILIAGSVVNFFAMNLAFCDLGNMFYGVHDVNFLSTIPAVAFEFEFVLLLMAAIRTYLYPDGKKKLLLRYSKIWMLLSVVGLAGAILSGPFVYGSYLSSYPFHGYLILSLLVHGAGVLFAPVSIIRIKKLPEDSYHPKINLRYGIYTIFLVLFVLFSMNRFGAFIWAPVYIQWSTFYLTLPFYLTLTFPLLLLIYYMGYVFGIYEAYADWAIKGMIVILALTLVIGVSVFIIGYHNTQFIAAISPALAVERLATKPLGTISLFVIVEALGNYFLIHALRKKKKESENR